MKYLFYLRKSYYRHKCPYDHVVLLIVTVSILFLGLALEKESDNAKLICAICVISLLEMFFAEKSYLFLNVINKEYKLTQISKMYRTRFLIVQLASIISWISISLYWIFINNDSFWLSVVPLGMLAYSIGYLFNCIVQFSDKGYVSGYYIIKFSEFDKIVIEKEQDTCFGKVITVTFWKKDTVVGFDKLFEDDYAAFIRKFNAYIYESKKEQ